LKKKNTYFGACSCTLVPKLMARIVATAFGCYAHA
jgi:hypothetical protein